MAHLPLRRRPDWALESPGGLGWFRDSTRRLLIYGSAALGDLARFRSLFVGILEQSVAMTVNFLVKPVLGTREVVELTPMLRVGAQRRWDWYE
jgi:hypothetical protein